MRTDHLKSLLGICLVTAILPVFAETDAEDDLAYLHYQNIVQSKESGVYEDGDTLFIQVKVPFDRRKDNLKKKKADVVLIAYDLLKKWAIDYTEPDRRKVDLAPKGVKFAKNVALEYLPGWQFREWSPRLNMREFPHKTDEGYYVLGQSVEKADVIKNIPESFRKPFAQDDWQDALVAAVQRGVAKKGRAAVVAKCRAWDALLTAGESPSTELKSVVDGIEKYLKDSSRADAMRESRAQIVGPSEIVSWSDANIEQTATTNVAFVAATNINEKAEVVSVSSNRPQTVAEIAKCGRSLGSVVHSETTTADAEVVVETTKRTIVETRRYVRRKTVSKIYGTARFEDLFLTGGSCEAKPTRATALGETAAKTYFDSTPLAEKDKKICDALRENPGDVRLWNYFGKCLMSEDDKWGAVICYRVALRIEPDYEFAIVNLAEAYDALGFRELAIGLATYGRAVSKDGWCMKHAESLLTK